MIKYFLFTLAIGKYPKYLKKTIMRNKYIHSITNLSNHRDESFVMKMLISVTYIMDIAYRQLEKRGVKLI